MKTQPMQPINAKEEGVPPYRNMVARFRPTKLVQYLLDRNGKIGLNELAIYSQTHDVSADDQMQFAMLIGYSVGGFGDLSYVDDETRAEAVARGNVALVAVLPYANEEARDAAKGIAEAALVQVQAHEQDLSALRAQIAKLSDEERHSLLDGYCRSCGCKQPENRFCHCSNDE